MIQIATPAVMAAPRLMSAGPKVAMRILRAALRQIAEEESLDRLSLEESYTGTRSALAHLLAHDRYRTQVEDMIADLVRKTREMLAIPGIERLSRRSDWVQRLELATDNLDEAHRKTLADSVVSLASVQLFIKVVEAAQERYVLEGYDSSDFISDSLFALAHLVAQNHEAYNKTLNT